MTYYNDYSHLLESLILLNNYKNIIEIGVNAGDTTITLCQAAKKVEGHVYGFDMWDNHGLFNQFKQSGNKKEVENKLKNAGYNNFTLYQKNTFDSDFSDFITSKVPHPYDLVFIDGCHSYKGCLNDFKSVYKNLSTIGSIIFHDTQRIDGCREFILDLRTKYNDGTFDIIDFHGGYKERQMGISILTKRQFPVLKIPINQLCGSPSTPEKIEKREEEWYHGELKKHENYTDTSNVPVDEVKLSEIKNYRPEDRTYGK